MQVLYFESTDLFQGFILSLVCYGCFILYIVLVTSRMSSTVEAFNVHLGTNLSFCFWDLQKKMANSKVSPMGRH